MIRAFSARTSVSLLVLSLACLFAFAITLAPAPAGAKVKQSNCSKQKVKVKKSKGKAKAMAKRNLKSCMQARTVYSQVKNSHFYGSRADGQLIDALYCANGKFQGSVGTGGEVEKRGWFVKISSYRSAKRYVAQLIVPRKGGGTNELGVARNGNKWQVGYTLHDEVKSLGNAEKRDGRSLCAKL